MQITQEVRKRDKKLTDGSIVFEVIIAEVTRSDVAPFLNKNEMVVVDCQDEKNADELVSQLLIAGFAQK
jgi:hypothetical protein